MSEKLSNTIYGTAVALIKDRQIYLNRRSEKMASYKKKWQFTNGRIIGTEASLDAGVRLINEQANINTINKMRLDFATTIQIEETREFYYVYLVNLTDNETPENTYPHLRGEWRRFELKDAIVLDVVPGIRGIIKGLYRGLIKFEKQSDRATAPLAQSSQLTQGEQSHLAKLGPKMTRLL
jgi:hypothetical protein